MLTYWGTSSYSLFNISTIFGYARQELNSDSKSSIFFDFLSFKPFKGHLNQHQCVSCHTFEMYYVQLNLQHKTF